MTTDQTDLCQPMHTEGKPFAPLLLVQYRTLSCAQAKKALKNVLQRCVQLEALEPLLHEAPPNILKYVIAQFSKILPHNAKARKSFVTSGGLKKLQEIRAEPGSALAEYVHAINSCYPEEIVKYYSPGYAQQLLDRVSDYNPPNA